MAVVVLRTTLAIEFVAKTGCVKSNTRSSLTSTSPSSVLSTVDVDGLSLKSLCRHQAAILNALDMSAATVSTCPLVLARITTPKLYTSALSVSRPLSHSGAKYPGVPLTVVEVYSFHYLHIDYSHHRVEQRTLLKYPQLYGSGQREESYNSRSFWITMADTLYQSVVVYFIPLFVYWNTTVGISSLGDLWTIAVVIVFNLHLAMDVLRWSWVTHAGIYGSIIATCFCVMTIDSIPLLFGYWAIFVISKTSLFWALLLVIVVAPLTPRFVVKVLHQHYHLNDIQIAREAEKFGNFRQVEQSELGMNSVMETQRR